MFDETSLRKQMFEDLLETVFKGNFFSMFDETSLRKQTFWRIIRYSFEEKKRFFCNVRWDKVWEIFFSPEALEALIRKGRLSGRLSLPSVRPSFQWRLSHVERIKSNRLQDCSKLLSHFSPFSFFISQFSDLVSWYWVDSYCL